MLRIVNNLSRRPLRRIEAKVKADARTKIMEAGEIYVSDSAPLFESETLGVE